MMNEQKYFEYKTILINKISNLSIDNKYFKDSYNFKDFAIEAIPDDFNFLEIKNMISILSEETLLKHFMINKIYRRYYCVQEYKSFFNDFKNVKYLPVINNIVHLQTVVYLCNQAEDNCFTKILDNRIEGEKDKIFHLMLNDIEYKLEKFGYYYIEKENFDFLFYDICDISFSKNKEKMNALIELVDKNNFELFFSLNQSIMKIKKRGFSYWLKNKIQQVSNIWR